MGMGMSTQEINDTFNEKQTNDANPQLQEQIAQIPQNSTQQTEIACEDKDYECLVISGF
jgi:hypothetical protein